jgi:pimeloyl-ACP methyl ester carboxylesterase
MYAHWRTAVQDGTFRTELAGIDVPVRIAWGTKDRTLPRKDHSGFFRTMLPDAEWIELADAGHLPQLDDPPLVARAILEVTRRR